MQTFAGKTGGGRNPDFELYLEVSRAVNIPPPIFRSRFPTASRHSLLMMQIKLSTAMDTRP
jgi:hypothetical protein